MTIPWKRALRWSLFLGCLTLLGVGIYRFEAHEPRWTVEGGDTAIDSPLRISADGMSVYTSPFKPPRNHSVWIWDFETPTPGAPPPRLFRIWDLATGTSRSAHPARGQLTANSEFSKDGRYFAGVCGWPQMTMEGSVRFVCLVDLQTGEEHALPLPCWLDDAPIHFSPCGQYLIVGLTEQEGPVQIYECATGQMLDEIYCWGLVWHAVFSEGCLLYVDKEDGEQRRLKLWNLRERKVAATLADLPEETVVRMIDHFLVIQDNMSGQCRTWNLRTRKVEATWQSTLSHASLGDLVRVGEIRCAFVTGSADKTDRLETWDIHTGQRIAADKHPGWGGTELRDPSGRFWARYSPPQQMWGFSSMSLRRGPPNGFQMMERPSLKKLWGLDATQLYTSTFTHDGNRIIVAPSAGDRVFIRDSASGNVQQSIVVNEIRGVFNDLNLTVHSDSKHLLIQQSASIGNGLDANMPIWRRVLQWVRLNRDDESNARDLLIVHNLETGRECLRLRGWNVEIAALSDDGTTLVTSHAEQDGPRVLRFWDVGATKPLRWPIAIPATLGVMLWGLAKGVARWRKRRAGERVVAGAAVRETASGGEGEGGGV